MNRHTLRVLEFDRIRLFLESFAASPGAKRRCKTLAPATALATVQTLLAQTSEMRREIEDNGPLPLSDIFDISPPVHRARVRDARLEPAELLQIKNTLETAAALNGHFSGLEAACPLIHAFSRDIQPLGPVTGPIARSIGRQGAILDAASPALADIRRRLKKLRVNILSILQNQFADTDISRAFQDDFITLRNNRYVIPVRSDSKSMIPGVVHDQSQSGATFFVEPLSVVGINNELQLLHKEEYYEEIRILTGLTRLVHEHAEAILGNLAIVEEIDLMHARALLGRALQASAPQVTPAGALRLAACRHPMLLARFVPEETAPGAEGTGASGYMQHGEAQGHWMFDRSGVTPIDIIREPEVSTLIITGANAGGKTVALKTYGLFVLMAQAGMHIPADSGAIVPLCDSVYADIGDEQNIEASLSTFSARMALIRTIVTSAGPASLVVLDELGSGTDPTEGGALAGAILDYLHAKGCTTVVTTHLTTLKTYAYRRTFARNVSVEFDPDTLRPLYSLVYGVPGISNALAIARHMGIPEEILASAAVQLDHADKHVGELIAGLERSQQALAVRKQRLETILQAARRHQQALEALATSAGSRREKLLKQFEADARTLLRQSESAIKDILRQLKRSRIVRPGAAGDDPRARFDHIKQSLQEKFPRRAAARTPIEALSAGQAVRVLPLETTGTVVSADNQARRAEVDLGRMRVKTRFEEMEIVASQPARTPRKAAPASQSGPAPASIAEKQINVIGMRAADALPVVDKAIDDALLQGAGHLEIIHGRGTGRLRQAIHEHLKDNPQIAGFGLADPAQGGSGITIVHMR